MMPGGENGLKMYAFGERLRKKQKDNPFQEPIMSMHYSAEQDDRVARRIADHVFHGRRAVNGEGREREGHHHDAWRRKRGNEKLRALEERQGNQ